ncbi:hypothetical protein [Rhodoflexus sp.]
MKTTPDSNEKNAVDELFRKALANHEAEASVTAHQKWQAAMARLNKGNDRRRGWIWWTVPAALLVAGIATGGYYYATGVSNTTSGDSPTEIIVSTEKIENAKQPSEAPLHLTTEKASKEMPQEVKTAVATVSSANREQQQKVTLPADAHKQADVPTSVQEATGEPSLPIPETVEQSAAVPTIEEKVQLEVIIRLGSEASAKGSASADTPSAEVRDESNLKRLWKRINGEEVAKDTAAPRVERRILGFPADSLFKKKDKRKTQD